MPLLIRNISKSFGGVLALKGVSAEMVEGQVSAIIGSNGAGKSTLFNVIGGYLAPDDGEVLLSNEDGTNSTRLTGMEPYKVANSGVGMLFQSVRVFERLSSLDNVLTGFQIQEGEDAWSALLRRANGLEKKNIDEAMRLLRFVGLDGKHLQRAGSLSFGEQKLLSIARMLAARSRVLLLDEPTSGVHPKMIDSLLSLIVSLAHRDSRIVVLIEHNPSVVRQVSDMTFTMERGKIIECVKAKQEDQMSRLTSACI
jgi:branched-chain amino acid transport system ATP-binding protein